MLDIDPLSGELKSSRGGDSSYSPLGWTKTYTELDAYIANCGDLEDLWQLARAMERRLCFERVM